MQWTHENDQSLAEIAGNAEWTTRLDRAGAGSFARLCAIIQTMHDEGWIHRTRNYPLNEATIETALTHVIEEFAELQAAVLAFKHMKVHDQARGEQYSKLEEAADFIGCVIHLYMLIGLGFEEIWTTSATKMFATFRNPTQSAHED